MDTESPYKDVQPTIILGQPFLAMIDARINCRTGIMDITFGNKKLRLNAFNYVNSLTINECYQVDVIEEEVQNHAPRTLKVDPLELYLTYENEEILDVAEVQEIQECLVSSLDHQRPSWSYKVEPLPANFDTTTKPSLEVPPTLELKPLPSNLKYDFLGHNNTLPVIVASDLSGSQEEALLKVLSKYKAAVGWTIADLKGISPSLCMHRIVTDPDVKPSKDAQRRLNPNMKEVVKKKVLKWLDAGIIYPISDSKWVSPTQTMPKKAGITVVETESEEKLTTRPVTGWRVCIDYWFYRRFIKDFSVILKPPLCNLLLKEERFDFNESCLKAFNMLKQKLVEAPILQSPDWSKPFEIMCDASDYATEAVLGQRVDKKPVVIFYASKTFS
nr:hypothetical protein [Tanacetum cinerariifolium]